MSALRRRPEGRGTSRAPVDVGATIGPDRGPPNAAVEPIVREGVADVPRPRLPAGAMPGDAFARVVQAVAGDAGILGEPLERYEMGTSNVRRTSELRRVVLVGASRRVALYVKLVRESPGRAFGDRDAAAQALAEYRELERVSRAFVGAERARVARPLAYVEEERAIVTEEVPGLPLARVVHREGRRPTLPATGAYFGEIGRGIAEWLQRFQSLSSPATIDIDEVRRYCDDRLHFLVRSPRAEFLEQDRAAALARFDALAAALTFDDLFAVDVHGDFTPENIFVDGRTVTVIDFVGNRRGLRHYDLAHLLMQLDAVRRKPWISADAVAALQRGLVTAFGPGLTRAHPAVQLALLQNVVARAAHRVDLRGSWLRRRYSAYLWQGIDRTLRNGDSG